MSWSEPELDAPAKALAERLGIPVCRGDEARSLMLELTPERLQLRAPGPNAPGAVSADFQKLDYRRRHGSLRREAIARAVGLKGDRESTVVDATAGLGRDGFMLASLGARVTLIERSPIVAELLADGLRRAAQQEALAAIVARLTLLRGPAETILPTLSPAPEVVYLDPMYPESGTRAQVKKEMQLLRELLGADPDPAQLLALALNTASRRVVVKRPLKAPPISGRRPSHQIEGRSTRFDVYLTGS